MRTRRSRPPGLIRLGITGALSTLVLFGALGATPPSASAAGPAVVPPGGSAQQAMPGAWTAQNLPGGTDNLVDVSCPTVLVCAATAQTSSAGSMLVSTTDGGATWTARAFPPDQRGNPSAQFLACPAADRCYVTFVPAGNQLTGGILLTTDLGASWSVLPVPAGATDVDHIACSSPDTCYADSTLGIIGTGDGGATWRVQAAIPATVLSCPAQTSTCFALASQTLYATSDSGTTWTPVSTLPGTVGGNIAGGADISCPEVADCYVAGVIVAPDMKGTPTLWVSHDGGGTWSNPSAPYPDWPGPPPGSGRPDFGGTFQSIDCPTSQDCFVRGHLHGGPIADATTDGGAIWTAQNPASGTTTDPASAEPYSTAISCPAADRCVAVGAPGAAVYAPMSPAGFVAMAATRDGGGYWEVSSDGTVFHYGDAGFYGSMGGLPLTEPVVGMAATPDDRGYWLVAADGGIFAFGDAAYLGSTGALSLNGPIVGMSPTVDGRGYWLVAADGGIFAFGDAAFHGSMGASPLNGPVVAMSADLATGGYWLVASDGGVFSFDAPFLGSTGDIVLNEPVVGIESDPSGSGYRFVAADGGVFCFGVPFLGSMGGIPINRPMVGLAADGSTGYWSVAGDGGIFSFGSAPFLGSPV